MIVALGGIKGGSGKTTLATNLVVMRAAAGHDVLLIDADPQHTSLDFTTLRTEKMGEPGYTCCPLEGTALRTQVMRMKSKYSDIFIDLPGRDTLAQRTALSVADWVLVPFPPRSFDVWTASPLQALVEEVWPVNPGLRARIFLNKADARGSDNEESEALLRETISGSVKFLEFDDVPVRIGNRKAFSNAAAGGVAITEVKPGDEKATAEMQTVYDLVFAR